jgi:hypothetical protein
MFMYAKQKPELNVLIFHFDDNHKEFVPAKDLFPFTRLQISQMITSSIRRKNNLHNRFFWIQDYLIKRKIRNTEKIKQVIVARVTFPIPFRGEKDFDKCQIKIIQKIPWEQK